MTRDPEVLERQRAAYHEAGHAVAAFVLCHPVPHLSITAEATSICSLARSLRAPVRGAALAASTAMILVAGVEAERRGCERVSSSSSADLAAPSVCDVRSAREMARAHRVPPATFVLVSLLLAENWVAVQRVARVLMDRRDLGSERAIAIIGRALRVA